MGLEAIALGAQALAQGVDLVQGTELAPPAGAEVPDFSVMGLFLKAGPVVQAVILLLVAASFWSWAIIIEKALQFRRFTRERTEFEADFWSGASLEDLYARIGADPATPSERVFVAGMVEWSRSLTPEAGLIPGTQARVERAMGVAIQREGERIGERLNFLATTGAVAPFVGLFGTVWGIKTSFEAIALQQNTNLAVVAPGIAEALFATALGLLAAIPAVIAYNRLLTEADRLTGALDAFADEFSTILGRQIDRAAVSRVR